MRGSANLPGRATAARCAAVLLIAVGVVGSASPASAAVDTRRIVVLLCKFQDRLEEPQPKSYYENFYSDKGAGLLGAYDFYTDVSYGNLDLRVDVTDWITVPMNRYVFTGAGSNPQDCADAGGIDLTRYDGVIVTPNLGFEGDPPSTDPIATTLAEPVAEGDTTIEVTSSEGFPEPPFPAWLGGAYVDGVNVTAVNGTTWTVQRDYPDSRTPKAHMAGGQVVFFSVARFQGTTGLAWLPADIYLTGATHEMVHLLGFAHSRSLSMSTIDYTDCWDIASALGCVYRGPFGYDVDGYNGGTAGPGLNAANLDSQGWLRGYKTSFDNSTCRSQTYTLAALSHRELGGVGAVLVPAQVSITNAVDGNGNPSSTTTSSNYYVEFRHKSAWDRAIPMDAVLLHLDGGGDGHSYWVDGAGGDGALTPGESYIDTDNDVYLAVNAIDSGAKSATVTLGSCPINTTLTWTGDTHGEFSDQVTLAANLTVNGAPVPNAAVNLTMGSQACPSPALTDAAGHAECTITLNQEPALYRAEASYSGDGPYVGATATQAFVVEKETTALAYTGATEGTYSDAAIVSAILTDPDASSPIVGRTVSFALDTDACSATTDLAGVASCEIVPTQAAGSYTLTATFAGDREYVGSSAQATFVVSRETTVLSLVDVAFAALGDPLTLSGSLVEDDGPAVAGRGVVFTVGATQSCTGTTDATGTASCTIPELSQPLGPVAITALFAGDPFYLGSSDLGRVTVFAWTPGGNFVIGDGNEAAGEAATFWADDWYLRNTVSGGAAPAAFKGFANAPAGQTACGGVWSSNGGNSAPPTGSVPEYTAVLVTDNVAKFGSSVVGSKPHVAIVHINAGYAPSPGHAGTAIVLGRYC